MWGLLLSRIIPILTGPISQFVTGINFNQVFSTIWSVIVSLSNSVRKYWRFYLPAFLISLQLLTAFGWYKDHNALKIERQAHQLDIKTYKKAQADAVLQAEVIKKQLLENSKVKANEADQSYTNLLTKYRTNLLRYQTTQRQTGKPSGGQSSGPAQSIDGSGGGSGLSNGSLIISQNDASICATNTARLQAAHDWAIHLNDVH